MAKSLWLDICIILLALILVVSVVSGEDEAKADLNVAKALSSNGQWAVNETVTWVVTVDNGGPSDATNVTVEEDISKLINHGAITVSVSDGIYDDATNTWTIQKLANGTSATMTLATNFTTAGEKKNSVTVTADQTDDDMTGNSAESKVVIYDRTILSADLKIRPTTLNVNANGVFTVFVTLMERSSSSDGTQKPSIDYATSSLTCSEAQLIDAHTSNKGGGTLIAKFYREDLRNITEGDGIQVNCSGTLSVDGESVYVEGSDTIRVIGEKKGLDKFFSDMKKLFGIEEDDAEVNETEEVNATATVTLAPESYKNQGQEKKVSRNSGQSSPSVTETSADTTKSPKGNAGKSGGNGNNNKEDEDDGDNDNGSGQGNSNVQGSDQKIQKNSNGKNNK